MLNSGSTLGTAILRGAYLAVGTFLVGFLPAYAATDDLKGPLIAGGMGALFALGFRGGVEGLSDKSRDERGRVLPGDVGQRPG